MNISRNIWCSVNHRPVYSPLRDLHNKVKAKQFYNDGNLKGVIQVDAAGYKYVETPDKNYHFYQDGLTDHNLTFIGYEEVRYVKYQAGDCLFHEEHSTFRCTSQDFEDMEWFTQDIINLDLEQPDCRDCK